MHEQCDWDGYICTSSPLVRTCSTFDPMTCERDGCTLVDTSCIARSGGCARRGLADCNSDPGCEVGCDSGFVRCADVCIPEAEAAGDPTCTVDLGPLTGESYLYVVDALDVGAADPAGDPSIVPGFNLDDRVSDATDREGCRKPDTMSPPPDSVMGVDNQLGPVLADTEDMFFIRANMEQQVRDGTLLVLFDVRGVDDFINDDRVEVDALFGVLPAGLPAPLRTPDDGDYISGQTFDIDSRSLMSDRMTARVTLRGKIVNGRVQAGPGDLSLSLPTAGTVVDLGIQDIQLRFDISPEGIARGVLGGGLDVAETVTALSGTGIDPGLVELVLQGAADLKPDSRGICQSVSIALVLRGVPATRGDVISF